MFLSGTPLIIRSSKFYLQPLVYINQRLQIEFIIPKFIEGSNVLSGTPLIIRSSKLYLQPLVYIHMWWPAVVQAGRELDNGRSPHVCVQTKACKYSLKLLMMRNVPLETCWAFNKFLNNKFYYKFASCWLFLLIHDSSVAQHIVQLLYWLSYPGFIRLKKDREYY